MFIDRGVLAIAVTRNYPKGDAMRVGRGHFPTYVGAILISRAFGVGGESIGRWGWRPLLCLSAAFAGFGLLIDEAGFVLS